VRHDLELGATIGRDDIEIVTRNAKTIPADALRTTHDAVGRIVVVPMLRDAIVTARGLANADRTGLDGVVGPGARAVHVVLTDGFRPPPHAVVDVLAAFDPATVQVAGADASAVAVARAARVIALDERGRSDGSDGTGVTLLVTEAEARAVAFAATNSELS